MEKVRFYLGLKFENRTYSNKLFNLTLYNILNIIYICCFRFMFLSDAKTVGLFGLNYKTEQKLLCLAKALQKIESETNNF